MSTALPPRGRGTATNLHNRFAPTVSVTEDDGWYQEVPETQGTEVRIETAKSIITRNNSPDLPFDRSINPYRGCEHGCIYSVKGYSNERFESRCVYRSMAGLNQYALLSKGYQLC
ncbi:Radical SAM domain protein [Pseudomonas synxantha]|uniref:Radical SAM domain protein n=1 Tax=Pseudomonas synxantha TaxID=47883 RepID=A0AAU8TP03_9PSED|nr:Radical SAM domain protein [Pseudomonas synxantha]